jgi:hypothetical protein
MTVSSRASSSKDAGTRCGFEAWKRRFAEKRDITRPWRGKPLRKTQGARRCRWTICFDGVPDYRLVPALVFRSAIKGSARGPALLSPFLKQSAHPGLQFKKVEGEDDIYSVCIGLGYRGFGGHEERLPSVVLDWRSFGVRPLGLSVAPRVSERVPAGCGAGEVEGSPQADRHGRRTGRRAPRLKAPGGRGAALLLQ